MNIKTLKFPIWALVPVILIAFTSCKKKTTTTDPAPAKTLNKATLTPKKWYNSGSTIIHDFKSGGVYGATGEWKWVGTSDTMEIKQNTASGFVKWKIWWNTNNEMTCEWIGNGGQRLFKDKAW